MAEEVRRPGMKEEHPNVALLARLDLRNLASAADLFAKDLFEKLGGTTGGTFQVEPISVTPVGDELVVALYEPVGRLDAGSGGLEVGGSRRV